MGHLSSIEAPPDTLSTPYPLMHQVGEAVLVPPHVTCLPLGRRCARWMYIPGVRRFTATRQAASCLGVSMLGLSAQAQRHPYPAAGLPLILREEGSNVGFGFTPSPSGREAV